MYVRRLIIGDGTQVHRTKILAAVKLTGEPARAGLVTYQIQATEAAWLGIFYVTPKTTNIESFELAAR